MPVLLRHCPEDVGMPEIGCLVHRRAPHQADHPAGIRARVEQHANDVGASFASGEPKRGVAVVKAAHDRRAFVDGGSGRDEPLGLADVARLNRRHQRQSTDPLGVGRVPRLDQAGDRVEAFPSRKVERRLLPVASDRRPGAAIHEQSDCLLVLAQDRIHERRVPENGRLLIDEGSVVEEQPQDVGVARLRRLVERRRTHARLNRKYLCAGREQELHHLRWTEPGGDHQGREAFRAAAVRVRP
jgi:hypothetical protein